MVPIDSLTDPEDQALYTQLENDTSLQLIDTSFRESLTNLSETGQVDLTVDTLNFSLPGMGHRKCMDKLMYDVCHGNEYKAVALPMRLENILVVKHRFWKL